MNWINVCTLSVSENVKDEKPVDINLDELQRVLERAVKITAHNNLQSLLDLHNQLSRIIKQYLRTHNRRTLPKVSLS